MTVTRFSGSSLPAGWTAVEPAGGHVVMGNDDVIIDTATDVDLTLLEHHTPDRGGAWEPMLFTTSDVAHDTEYIVFENRLCSRPSLGDRGAVHRNTQPPLSDEYDINVTWSFGDASALSRFHVLCWGMTPTGTTDSTVDRYMLIGDANSEQWELYKTIGGSANRVLLDVAADATIPDGQFAVRVEVRNGSMAVLVNNVQVVSSTDTEIIGRGHVGVGIGRGDIQAGHWQDDFSVRSIGADYVRLTSDPGANFDSLSGGVTVPQGPRMQHPVSGSFDYAVGLAAAVNTAPSQGVDLLALDIPTETGVRFSQYVSSIGGRDVDWYVYQRSGAGQSAPGTTQPPNNLWGPRSWMRLTYDQSTQTYTCRASHTGKPGTWATVSTFVSELVPSTFEIGTTAFGPDAYGREQRIAVVVDMDGRGDDATTVPPAGVERNTVLNANLSGSELPAELTSTVANGGTVTMVSGYAAEVTADGPMAWWRFSETQGTTVVDEVGGHDGTVSGAVDLDVPSPWDSLGSAADYSGGQITVDGAAFNFGAADAFTVECWVRADNTGTSYVAFIDKTGLSNSNGGWDLEWTGSAVRFLTAGNSLDWTSGAEAELAVGGHLVATFDAGQKRLYWNGAQVASGVQTTFSLAPNELPLSIGSSSGGSALDGLIDEVAVYSAALTPQQITTHYQTGVEDSGYVRMTTEMSTPDSYAWITGPGTLPLDHGMLLRYQVPQPSVQNSFAGIVIRSGDTTDLPGSQVLTDKFRPGTGFLAEINGAGSYGDIFRLLTAHPVAIGENFDSGQEFYGFSMINENVTSPIDGSDGLWLWLRIEQIGGYYRARAWYDGSAEPDTWFFEGEDYTQRDTNFAISWGHNDGTTGGTSTFDVSVLEMYEVVSTDPVNPNALDGYVLVGGVEVPVQFFVLDSGTETRVTTEIVDALP